MSKLRNGREEERVEFVSVRAGKSPPGALGGGGNVMTGIPDWAPGCVPLWDREDEKNRPEWGDGQLAVGRKHINPSLELSETA